MVARLITETDVIEVANPPVLLYGQPGAGKTSLAQTCTRPLTLDFDGGAHRSFFRKSVLRFDTWADVVEVQRDGLKNGRGEQVVEPQFANFDTVALDTVGTLLRYMGRSIVAANAKAGTKAGGLSLQGYGVLKETFDAWLDGLRALGKQIVMIAHEKEDRDGDSRILRPDIPGGSYSIVMQAADLVGYVAYRNDRRWIGWDPTDSYFAKNGARLKSGPIPSFQSSPNFMEALVAEAKHNLGSTAAASAQAAQVVEEWITYLASDPNIEQVNDRLGEVVKLQNGCKAQVGHLIKQKMNEHGYVYDKTAKRYVPKEVAA